MRGQDAEKGVVAVKPARRVELIFIIAGKFGTNLTRL